jgi:hypothetical protein
MQILQLYYAFSSRWAGGSGHATELQSVGSFFGFRAQEWEQGRRKPDATSRAYLAVIAKNREAVLEALVS